MGWAEAEKAVKETGGGNLFVRLDDGDSIVGVFVGEPHVRSVIWNQDTGRTEDYDDSNPVHRSEKPKSRFLLNFFDTSAGEMRIFELNSMAFETLITVRNKFALEKWAFEVKRSGKRTETKYSILPEKEIDATISAMVAKAPLHDLGKPQATENTNTGRIAGGDDMPF